MHIVATGEVDESANTTNKRDPFILKGAATLRYLKLVRRCREGLQTA